MNLLLWDIDGTLLRTGGAGMRAMYRVADRLFGAGWNWEGVNPSGNLDPLIFAQAAALNRLDDDPSHHQSFHDHYIEALREELELTRAAVRVMPGVVEAIDLLHRRAQARGDVVQGLLTGNYTRAVPLKLAVAGIDPAWFPITAFGDEGKCRADLVALALRKFETRFGRPADPRRVIVIGDTPKDVECAHAHGCVALAVATGGYSVEVLRGSGADVAVEDLADPGPLLELIERA
jgi:phosphoglycolate phosphatase